MTSITGIAIRIHSINLWTGKGEFTINGFKLGDDLTVTNGTYILVTKDEVERALSSLQDAGAAAGCPPTKNIIEFITNQRRLVALALEWFGDMDGPQSLEIWKRRGEQFMAASKGVWP